MQLQMTTVNISGNMNKCIWGLFESPDTDVNLYSIGNDVYFNCDVSSESINKLQKEISMIVKNYKYPPTETPSLFDPSKKEKDLQIRLIINSCGGDVYEMLRFIDFMDIVRKQYPTIKFVSCINGVAFSAATLIAVAADVRVITPNSSVMIHQMSLWNGGPINFVNQRIKYLNNLYEKMINIYVQKTKQTRENIMELLSKETWYDAKSYLDAGFVDAIL